MKDRVSAEIQISEEGKKNYLSKIEAKVSYRG